MLKCDFNKIAKQLKSHFSMGVCSPCKFAAYFQNTFSYEFRYNLPIISKQIKLLFIYIAIVKYC